MNNKEYPRITEEDFKRLEDIKQELKTLRKELYRIQKKYNLTDVSNFYNFKNIQ